MVRFAPLFSSMRSSTRRKMMLIESSLSLSLRRSPLGKRVDIDRARHCFSHPLWTLFYHHHQTPRVVLPLQTIPRTSSPSSHYTFLRSLLIFPSLILLTQHHRRSPLRRLHPSLPPISSIRSRTDPRGAVEQTESRREGACRDSDEVGWSFRRNNGDTASKAETPHEEETGAASFPVGGA